jgi:two-component system, NtrC family, nitrogen regulation sensor histidine kinase NtrY
LISGLPGTALALYFILTSGLSERISYPLALVLAVFWVSMAVAARSRVVSPLRTFASMLGALREGDYSIRPYFPSNNDALGEIAFEISALSKTLQSQRIGAVDATNLLHTVIDAIDSAVFAFDDHRVLKLTNRAGARLLGLPSDMLIGRSASQLKIEDLLNNTDRVVCRQFSCGAGQWGLQQALFRQDGKPHHLVLVSDLSQPLREEEARAWQKLVRVFAHELNNSLGPIKSIAGSLSSLLKMEKRPSDWMDEMHHGLEVIESRASGLSRFVESYSRLARLPPPILEPCSIGPLIHRVIQIETRMVVEINPGPNLIVNIDPAQIEQVVINLVRNAVDAAQANNGAVRVTWRRSQGYFEILIEDGGLGFLDPSNMFVLFFTTKPGGSGIGLVLCRQIAEAHRGFLLLQNRKDSSGCVATLRLPVI